MKTAITCSFLQNSILYASLWDLNSSINEQGLSEMCQ